MSQSLALAKVVRALEHLDIYVGIEKYLVTKKYLPGPMELRENAKTAFSCRGPEPARKRKEVYQWSGGIERRRTELPVWQRKRE